MTNKSPVYSSPPSKGNIRENGRQKDRIYDRGYYHGENSGYPEEGYRDNHPDWNAWLDLIATVIPPPASFFDIGTAFGYLPDKAASRGYLAFGCDISSYALKQEPSFRDLLLRGDSETLPLKSGTADIVCLFDILEHLDDPVNALEEAVRILKPEGILIGATPDPLFFTLDEETHCFERCPSFWIHHLERLGLKTVFRFSNIPENFQFISAFRESPTAPKLEIFQHDYFSYDQDMVEIKDQESGKVSAVLRQGWDQLGPEGRRITEESASAYILNQSDSPVECRISLVLSCPATPPRIRLRIDSLVLDSYSTLNCDNTRGINSDSFPLPPGGHHIHIDLYPSQENNLSIKSLAVEILGEIDPGSHTLSLPFDLYQRYRFAGDLAEVLEPVSILDAGGNLGDAGGHLAVSREFFYSAGGHHPAKIISSDLRHCDHPEHVPGDGLALPFPDGSFEMTVSLDVLEHIPPESRLRFLEELDRVSSKWVLLAAPFSSDHVKKAESALVKDLGLHFLDEHSELGLPEEELVTDFFRNQKGRFVTRFENGCLPRWFGMLPLTQMVFSMHQYKLYSRFNRYYNENYYQKDCVTPGYRTVFLISRKNLTEEKNTVLESFPGRADIKAASVKMPQEPVSFPFYKDFLKLMEDRSREAADLSFLLTAREKHIEDLRARLDEYEKNPLSRILRKISRVLRRGNKQQAGKQ